MSQLVKRGFAARVLAATALLRDEVEAALDQLYAEDPPTSPVE